MNYVAIVQWRTGQSAASFPVNTAARLGMCAYDSDDVRARVGEHSDITVQAYHDTQNNYMYAAAAPRGIPHRPTHIQRANGRGRMGVGRV